MSERGGDGHKDMAFNPEWLTDKDKKPQDYYELAGVPRFDSDFDTISKSIRAAYRTVHRYQNHQKSDVAERATAMLSELGKATMVFSDPEKLRHYNAALLKHLRNLLKQEGPISDVNSWVRQQNVADAKVDVVARALVTGKLDSGQDTVDVQSQKEAWGWLSDTDIPLQMATPQFSRIARDARRKRSGDENSANAVKYYYIAACVVLLLGTALFGIWRHNRSRSSPAPNQDARTDPDSEDPAAPTVDEPATGISASRRSWQGTLTQIVAFEDGSLRLAVEQSNGVNVEAHCSGDNSLYQLSPFRTDFESNGSGMQVKVSGELLTSTGMGGRLFSENDAQQVKLESVECATNPSICFKVGDPLRLGTASTHTRTLANLRSLNKSAEFHASVEKDSLTNQAALSWLDCRFTPADSDATKLANFKPREKVSVRAILVCKVGTKEYGLRIEDIRSLERPVANSTSQSPNPSPRNPPVSSRPVTRPIAPAKIALDSNSAKKLTSINKDPAAHIGVKLVLSSELNSRVMGPAQTRYIQFDGFKNQIRVPIDYHRRIEEFKSVTKTSLEAVVAGVNNGVATLEALSIQPFDSVDQRVDLLTEIPFISQSPLDIDVDATSLAWCHDKPSLAIGTKNNVQLWNLKSGKRLWQEQIRSKVSGLLWSPKDTRLLAMTEKETLFFNQKGSGRTLLPALVSPDSCAAWAPNGRAFFILAKVGSGGPKLLSGARGEMEILHQCGYSTKQIAFHAKSNTVAVNDGGRIVLIGRKPTSWPVSKSMLSLEWRADLLGGHIYGRFMIWDSKGERQKAFDLPSSTDRVVWSHDGRYLASEAAELRVHKLDGTVVTTNTIQEYTGSQSDIAWSPVAPILAYAEKNGRFDNHYVRLWDTESRRTVLRTWSKQPIRSITWSPDGSQIAVAHIGGPVRIWQLPDK